MRPIPTVDRRSFLASSVAASAALIASQRGFTMPRFGDGASGKAATPLRILILGGTAFLGPEVVEAAQKRGHSVTLFNRGKTRAELFPDLEKLRGDRDPKKGEGLKSLEGRSWDIVVDNCGYYPRMVKASAELLAKNCKQYVYISSISAFKEGAAASSDESYPVATLEDPAVETMGEGFQNYGGLKALCEQAAEAAMPGRVTNIRPGFIVGPGDHTGRFNYWPLRARAGGEMLCPGDGTDAIQWIDVRDLAEWIVKCAEEKTVGVFLATGSDKMRGGVNEPGTMREVIDACAVVAAASSKSSGSPEGASTKYTWVPTEFLAAQKVSPGGDLPIWIPGQGEGAGFHRWNNARAVKAGLTFRPLNDTLNGILTWYDALPADKQKKFTAGMSREREAEVLKAWHASQKATS